MDPLAESPSTRAHISGAGRDRPTPAPSHATGSPVDRATPQECDKPLQERGLGDRHTKKNCAHTAAGKQFGLIPYGNAAPIPGVNPATNMPITAAPTAPHATTCIRPILLAGRPMMGDIATDIRSASIMTVSMVAVVSSPTFVA